MIDRAADGAARRRPRPPATGARTAPVTGRGVRGRAKMATVREFTSGLPRAWAWLAAAGLLLPAAAVPAWAGTTERVSVGPGGSQGNQDSGSYRSAVSTDGRFVAFESLAGNLVAADRNGTKQDIFVRDRQTDQIDRVSVGRGGRQANGFSERPAISA